MKIFFLIFYLASTCLGVTESLRIDYHRPLIHTSQNLFCVLDDTGVGCMKTKKAVMESRSFYGPKKCERLWGYKYPNATLFAAADFGPFGYAKSLDEDMGYCQLCTVSGSKLRCIGGLETKWKRPDRWRVSEVGPYDYEMNLGNHVVKEIALSNQQNPWLCLNELKTGIRCVNIVTQKVVVPRLESGFIEDPHHLMQINGVFLALTKNTLLKWSFNEEENEGSVTSHNFYFSNAPRLMEIGIGSYSTSWVCVANDYEAECLDLNSFQKELDISKFQLPESSKITQLAVTFFRKSIIEPNHGTLVLGFDNLKVGYFTADSDFQWIQSSTDHAPLVSLSAPFLEYSNLLLVFRDAIDPLKIEFSDSIEIEEIEPHSLPYLAGRSYKLMNRFSRDGLVDALKRISIFFYKDKERIILKSAQLIERFPQTHPINALHEAFVLNLLAPVFQLNDTVFISRNILERFNLDLGEANKKLNIKVLEDFERAQPLVNSALQILVVVLNNLKEKTPSTEILSDALHSAGLVLSGKDTKALSSSLKTLSLINTTGVESDPNLVILRMISSWLN